MSYLLKLKACIVGFGLLLFVSSAFGGNVTTVYFIPFEVETYVPITRKTIISLAWEKWTISSKLETSRLIAILSHGNKDKFDENRVRCEVVSDNGIYFIDSNGVVIKEEKSGIKIDKAAFNKFRDSLRADQRQILKK